MEGLIINYRRGRRTQTTNQMIIIVPDIDTKDKAKELVGKKVTYLCDGKNNTTIEGEVRSTHGSKGALRILFTRGMPGQAIGGKVSIK